MTSKVSLALPNLANQIAGHVAAQFPSLAGRRAIPGVWFTGSNIWSFVVGCDPRPDADWDIFATSEGAALAVADRLRLRSFPSCKTSAKRQGSAREINADHVPRLVLADGEIWTGNGPSYGEGYSYATASGEIDLWISTPGSALGELETYPEESHAHCRAAFSFTEGLLILPNPLVSAFAMEAA